MELEAYLDRLLELSVGGLECSFWRSKKAMLKSIELWKGIYEFDSSNVNL